MGELLDDIRDSWRKSRVKTVLGLAGFAAFFGALLTLWVVVANWSHDEECKRGESVKFAEEGKVVTSGASSAHIWIHEDTGDLLTVGSGEPSENRRRVEQFAQERAGAGTLTDEDRDAIREFGRDLTPAGCDDG